MRLWDGLNGEEDERTQGGYLHNIDRFGLGTVVLIIISVGIMVSTCIDGIYARYERGQGRRQECQTEVK